MQQPEKLPTIEEIKRVMDFFSWVCFGKKECDECAFYNDEVLCCRLASVPHAWESDKIQKLLSKDEL